MFVSYRESWVKAIQEVADATRQESQEALLPSNSSGSLPSRSGSTSSDQGSKKRRVVSRRCYLKIHVDSANFIVLCRKYTISVNNPNR